MRRLLLFFAGAFIFCTSVSFAQPTFTIQNKKDACDGLNNGSFEVLVSAANTPPLRVFVFGPPDQGPINATVGVPVPITGLQGTPAGKTYLVIVQDADGSTPLFVTIFSITTSLNATLVSSVNNTNCTTPDGSIDINATGGTAAYTYNWTGPNGFTATTQDISGLAGGTYSVTVSDAGTNCTRTLPSIVITDPSPAIQNVTTASPLVVCSGQGATISLASTEPAPVTYEVVVNGVPSGVTQPGTGGAISLNLPAGSFANGDVLAIRAVNGACTPVNMNGVVIVNIAPLPTATVSGGGTVCAGATLPNIVFTFTGTAPFTFTYTNGVTPVTVTNHPTSTFTLTNAPAGTYTVTALTDGNTCNATSLGGNASVIVNPLPTATISGGGAACTGSPLPNVTFTFTGTAPFNFTYNNGGAPISVANHPTNVFTITNAAAGTYTITALSDANCTGTSFGTPVAVTVNPLPTAAVSGGGTICAGGTLPGVTFTFTGTSPFTFTYTDGTTPVTVNNHPTTTFTLTNAPAGTYEVTALTDANTCNATDLGGTVSVIVNPLPTATISGGGAACAGSPLPNITFTFTGTAPFNFTYNNGGAPTVVTNHPSNIFTITNAAAGTYTITALSDANCTGTSFGTPVAVTVNPLPTAAVSGGGTICTGGTLPDVTFTFTGTAPFTFTYTDGTTPVTVNNHPSTTFTLNSAPAGTYNVTALTDATTCNATNLGGTVSVIVNALPTATISGGGPACAGQPLPNVTFTFTGTAPFNFTYNNGGAPIVVNNHPTSTFTITNAAAGTYTITALADANCTGTSFGTPVAVIVNPLPTASVSGGGTICTGGTLPNVTFTFTGTAPFTFTYTDGTTPVTITGHPTTTFTVNNAPAGTYTVSALTDANTCNATNLGGSVSVIVNPLPTATISGGGPVCAGQPLPNVTFTFTGTAPFNFTYNNGGAPIVVNNHPTNTFTITNAAAGTYTITALADANCTGTSFGTPRAVTVNPLPTASVSGGGTICAGGTLPNVTFTFTGTAPFNFTYTDGTTPVTVTGHATTTFTLNNAAAGTYSVTALTDANTCNATNLGGSVSVIVNPLPTAVISGGGPVCAGQPLPNVTFTFTGTAPFTFTYNNGGAPIVVNNHPTNTFTITNAAAGTYTITALSDANCTGTSFGTPRAVTVNPLPTASVSGGGTVCTGGTLPTVTFTFTGTAPFDFTYTDGTTPGTVTGHPATTFTITSPIAGTYSVTALTDANSCNATNLGGSVSVIVNPLPAATISGGGSVCAGQPLPDVTFTFTGTAPFNFTYNNGGAPIVVTNHPTNTFTITNAAAGTYTITALADANCTGTGFGTPVSVIVNPLPTASVSGGGAVCLGSPIPSVTFTFTGTAPFTFTYSDGTTPVTVTNHPTTTFTITNPAPGTYSVTALTDANSCTATSLGGNAVVLTAALPTASVSGGGAVCTGSTLPDVTFSFTGVAPFTFTYTDGTTPVTVTNHPASIFTLNNAPAGAYEVTALNDANCTATDLGGSVSVVVTPLPTASVSGGGTICSGSTAPDVTFSFTGTAPFNFTYTDGTTPVTTTSATSVFTLSNATAGTYEVTALTDANSCVATNLGGSVSVTVSPQPSITITSIDQVCETGTSTNINFSATTGSPDFFSIDFDAAANAAGFVDITDQAITTSPLVVNFPGTIATGTYNAVLTVRNSTTTCTSVAQNITFTVTTTPDAGSDATVDACNSETAFDLLGNLGGTPNTGGVWTDVNGSGAIITGNTINLNGVATGTYNFLYAITAAAPCVSASATLTINVEDAPDAGNNNTVTACNTNASFDLFASLLGTPDAGGSWTDVDGSGAVITGNQIDLTGLAPASYRFTYTVTGVAPCVDDVATVTINVIDTAPDAGSDNTVDACNSDAAFNLLASLGGTPDAGGVWTDIDASGATVTGDLVDLTTLAAGTYRFRYDLAVVGCGGASATVTVNVIQSADAGGDNTLVACSSATAFNLLGGLTGTPDAGGVWTDNNSSGAVITGNIADLSGVTTAGTYTFTYTVTGAAPCANATATLTLNISIAPDAGVDNTVTACNTDTAFDLFTALGGTPDAGGSWIDVDASGVVITGNSANLSGLAVGTYRFSYTVNGTAPCGNASAVVTVNVIDTTPDAGNDNTVDACNTNTAFDLFASLGGTPDAGGTWVDQDASGATITGNAIDLSTLTAGTYHYQYNLNVAGCGSASAIVTVNVTEGVDAGADNNATACNSDTAFDLIASLGGTPDAGGVWADVDGSGGVITANSINLTGVTAGTYTFTYTVTATAPCIDAVATLTLTVTDVPDAGTDAAVSACNSETAFDLFASLGGTPGTGGTWTELTTSGAPITGNTVNFTGVVAGTYTFQYLITGTAPCVDDAATVTVTVTEAPDAGTNATVSACNSVTTFDLFAALGGTPDAGGVWADTDGSGGVITGNNIDLTGVVAGTYDFTYTVTGTAPCVDATAVVTVNVANGPSVANAGPDQVICGGVFTATLAATAPTSGIGNWVIASGAGGLVVTPGSPTSQFVGSVGTAYTLRWIVTSGLCTPSIDDVVINFAASPAVTSPVTVCVNTAAPTLSALATGATSYNWYLGTGPSRTLLTSTATGSFTPGAELDRTNPGSVMYEVTAVYSCGESTGSQIVVNVSNTGACGGGTGNCATVLIRPNPKPATCTLSTGSVTFTISPFVPAVNNVGVVIKIDGVSSTNLTITRTQYNDTTFLNLPMGTYTYSIVYGDSSCIKPGTFTIDQSGTVGTPVASNIVAPVCFGSATGTATIDVAGETGNLLEYSFDGLTWTPFIAGAPGAVTGIPAGPAPTFERLISVRRNSSDPCNASVLITIQDQNPAIPTPTFTITDATCANNDGAIRGITVPSGGPYTFSLDGITFQSLNEFTGRPSGLDTLYVRHAVSGCTQQFEFTIQFPGFVDFTVTKEDASCDNEGVSGTINVVVNDFGAFSVALGTDPFSEPSPTEYTTYFNPGTVYDSLPRGQYFIFVKSAAAACPTRQVVTIGGISALGFDIAQGCNAGAGSNRDLPYLALTNIKGNASPGAPLVEVRIYREFTNPTDAETTISSVDLSVGESSLLFDYASNVFMQTPGNYIIRMTQVDPVLFCEVVIEKRYTVPRRLFASIGTMTKSFPDIPTGSLQVVNFDGGFQPYDIRIELDSSSSAELQFYETQFAEVGVNANLQFEMNYKNIPAGRYAVQIRDTAGCSIELIARVPLDTDIFIPNVFTPNEDDKNDEFFIRNLPAGSKLIITNRWGKQVYSTDDYQNNWKGDGVSDGIYFYRLQSGTAAPLTGWVEVLRGPKP